VDELAKPPWTTRYLQGLIDAPFINLTPGTRSGIIHDAAFAALLDALLPLEEKLFEMLEAQRRAEEEQASRELLQTIQRAFREALLALPAEEYDWFDIRARARGGSGNSNREIDSDEELTTGVTESETGNGRQRQFFEFAGPLFSVAVSPASTVVRVGEQRALRALPYDRSRRRVETDLTLVNNGHRDFVFAARNKSLKLRYLIRLYCKELVLKNFVGLASDQLLERMVELSLRTEENL
jgi:hypothetical protein